MGNEHHRFMQMALDEAKKGMGRTSPNPAVGAVVVADGEVVGRGYHQKAGTPHAEVHALADAGPAAKGATLYVTLEPCNHTGRTPPCTEAILRAGIAAVVIGMSDPNPQVTGGGAERLKAEGVEVRSGVLEPQCRALKALPRHGIRCGLFSTPICVCRQKPACSPNSRQRRPGCSAAKTLVAKRRRC